MSKTRDTEASISISRPTALGEAWHTWSSNTSPSTCHTAPSRRCRVVIPMVNRRSSCTASRTIRRPRGPSLPSSAAADVTSSHPGFAVTRRPRPQGRSTWQPSPATCSR
ncbi:alpha/beta hydrolase (plasmid) [Sinorhizobium americanum CCGM7]|nr:alpha/beta hydrolase [Sinorhizobium americanum CCGM7]